MATTAGRVYGGLTPEEREERRREQFMEAGLEVFAAKGWSASTVQDLCRAAGLSQRYFYELYSGREELFTALVHRIAKQVEAVVRASANAPVVRPGDSSRAVLTALSDYFTRDPRTVAVALVESFATPEFRALRAQLLLSFSEIAAQLMRRLHPHPEDADERSLELSARMLSGAITETLVAAIGGRLPGEPAELVEHLTRLYAAAAVINLNHPAE